MSCPSREVLAQIFPSGRADAFFDALYGDAEDGAYDIELACKHVEEDHAEFAFELLQRPGQCLRCNLTYGLPEVFRRHPVIDMQGVAQALAKALGWDANVKWTLGKTREISDSIHEIPFVLERT